MKKRSRQSAVDCLALANSAAVIALGWMLFCRFFYIPFPSLTVYIFQSWFPALNLQSLWSAQLLGQFLVGIITFPLAVWLTVFFFTKLYIFLIHR